MAKKVFVSPGVFTSETDLTFIAQQIGVTTLGLAGETVKGPAFEPIFIKNYEEFTALFGGLNPEKFSNNVHKFELPYVAKRYLSESNQLFVTRILGLTGYDAGSAWVITASAGIDITTTAVTSTNITFTGDFTGSTYGNISEPLVDPIVSLLPNPVLLTGTEIVPNDILSFPTGVVFTKLPNNTFTGISLTITQTSLTGNTGTVSGSVTTFSASSLSQYEGMTLAVVRSRASYTNDVLSFRTLQTQGGLSISNNAANNPYSEFKLSANTGSNIIEIAASLNPTNNKFLPKVVGLTPKDKSSVIYVEEVYSNMIKKLVSENKIWGISDSLIYINNISNYKQQYQTPETPWVVSELRGNNVERLFKFISISDGTEANREIKISVLNIDLENKTFDIFVRDFNDTDARPVVLERFSRCNLDPNDNFYVGKIIGTFDGEYELKSKYIMLVLNSNADINSIPSGFEGYKVRDYVGTNGTALQPEMVYKTEYDLVSERVRRVYLGISNTVGVDQTMYNWKGLKPNGGMWSAETKGFHMDSGATIAGNFVTTPYPFGTSNDVEGTPFESVSARKFTLVPYLGFDGWNEHRTARTNTDRYKIGRNGFINGTNNNEFQSLSSTEGTSDYYAYQKGIYTFANPESVNINVFATPSIDYLLNTELVVDTIDMIEELRGDSIYILNSPDGSVFDTDIEGLGAPTTDIAEADDIVGFLDNANLDSNHTATYWPHIQVRDTENNVNIFLPPTLEVVANIAFTDRTSFPWYATAGYTRGVTNSRIARKKLTEIDRDTLYESRINPMATFTDGNVLIFGNKNLQIKETLLNRLNIRRLLLQARKLISAVGVRLLFEPNDQQVRNEFLAKVNPILESIRKERGLIDFRVQLSNNPEEIDRNELRGKIFLKPITALEYIEINFTVLPTGASFENI
jgi:hypothetical protein